MRSYLITTLSATVLAVSVAQNYNNHGNTNQYFYEGHGTVNIGYGGGSTSDCNACRSSSGSKTKLTSLTLRYTGSNSGGSNNEQGSKFGFSGNPATFQNGAVTIRATNKKGNYGTYSVNPGQTFTIEARKFESESYFTFQGTGARVFFHTSCSVPLNVGDQFGSLVVVCFTNDNGGSCNQCSGAGSNYYNNGGTAGNTGYNSGNTYNGGNTGNTGYNSGNTYNGGNTGNTYNGGNTGNTYNGGNTGNTGYNGGDTYNGGNTGNTGYNGGNTGYNSYGGYGCVDDVRDCASVSSCPVCADDHKPTQLSFTFRGGPATLSNRQEDKAGISGASIQASSGSITCSGKRGTIGSSQVGIGQSIVLSRLGDAGNDIQCRVTGGGASQEFNFHISCSKDLNLGDRFGAVVLTGFTTQNKKNGRTRSSSDPYSCPTCEICPDVAKLIIPQPITLDCDGPMANHVRLQQWINAARCTSKKGRSFPVTNTPPLLTGSTTCSVSSSVTWTCVDEAGNVHKDSAVFAIIDRQAPELVHPPIDARSECDPTNPYNVPTHELNAWLADHGGMRAKDLCQEAQPCAGYGFGGNTGIYNNGSWHGNYLTPDSGNYAVPNVIPYSAFQSPANSDNTPYYKRASSLGQGERGYGYGQGDSTYDQSYACAYCPTTPNPVCANGEEYSTPCHAHCAGVRQFMPGHCGSQTVYNDGYVTSYSNGNCACRDDYSPVCSANGQRQYRNPCYATCAGDFGYINGDCNDYGTYAHNNASQYGCSHCGSYDQHVCGMNGENFNSPCHAACAGVYNFHWGECTIYAPASNCGNELTWTYTPPQFGPCTNGNYIPMQGGGAPVQCAEVTFTATDACGNSLSKSATYMIYDSSAPDITGGEDFEWPCNEDCAGYGQWESDASRFLHQWIDGHGCLNAEDCSPQIAWGATSVPYGKLCGTSGTVSFTATDPYGNVATKELRYSFPVPTKHKCYICGQNQYGSNSKASLQELALVYESTNPTPVNIRVFDSKGDRGVEPGSFVSVYPGNEFRSFVGEDYNFRKSSGKSKSSGGGSSSNKFPTNLVIETTGGGSTTIHTSCSQPLYIGQTFSLGNGATVRISGFRTDQSSDEQCPGGNGECAYPRVCGVPPPALPTYNPTPPPTNPPCQRVVREVCPYNRNSLTEIVFKYVDTNAFTNYQNGKADVHGDVHGNHVSISCSGDYGYGSNTQAVSLNGIYVLRFDGNLDTETQCTIQSQYGTQYIRIHTSCSEDLETEDQFGRLLLVGFRWNDGTYINNENCAYSNTPIVPYTNWQNGGVDGYGYVPPTPPTYVPPSNPPYAPPSNPPYAPPSPPPSQYVRQSLVDYLMNNPEYSIFYELLVQANIVHALSGTGPFTVLAPKNSAFQALGSALDALRSDIARLASVLLFHIMGGAYHTSQLSNGQVLASFNGPLTVHVSSGVISFSSASSTIPVVATMPDQQATNGILHGVSAVLLPYLQAPSPTFPPTRRYVPTTVAPPTQGSNGGYCTQTDACSQNSRINSITFKYVGYNGNDHRQMSWGKGYVRDMSPEYKPSANVVLNSYANTNYDANPQGHRFKVNLGEEFTVRGNPAQNYKLKNNLIMKVGGAKMKISTNCGAHLSVGDKFGVVVVTGWSTIDSHECYMNNPGALESDGSTGSGSAESSSGLSSVGVAGIVVGTIAAVAFVVAAVVTQQKKAKAWRSGDSHQ